MLRNIILPALALLGLSQSLNARHTELEEEVLHLSTQTNQAIKQNIDSLSLEDLNAIKRLLTKVGNKVHSGSIDMVAMLQAASPALSANPNNLNATYKSVLQDSFYRDLSRLSQACDGQTYMAGLCWTNVIRKIEKDRYLINPRQAAKTIKQLCDHSGYMGQMCYSAVVRATDDERIQSTTAHCKTSFEPQAIENCYNRSLNNIL